MQRIIVSDITCKIEILFFKIFISESLYPEMPGYLPYIVLKLYKCIITFKIMITGIETNIVFIIIIVFTTGCFCNI